MDLPRLGERFKIACFHHFLAGSLRLGRGSVVVDTLYGNATNPFRRSRLLDWRHALRVSESAFT
jgi:hypothetical protein